MGVKESLATIACVKKKQKNASQSYTPFQKSSTEIAETTNRNSLDQLDAHNSKIFKQNAEYFAGTDTLQSSQLNVLGVKTAGHVTKNSGSLQKPSPAATSNSASH